MNKIIIHGSILMTSWYWILFSFSRSSDSNLGKMARRNSLGYDYQVKEVYQPIEDEE